MCSARARAQFFDRLPFGGQNGKVLLPGVSDSRQRFALIFRPLDLARYHVGPLPGGQTFVERGVRVKRADRGRPFLFHVRDARVHFSHPPLRERENTFGFLLGPKAQVKNRLKTENKPQPVISRSRRRVSSKSVAPSCMDCFKNARAGSIRVRARSIAGLEPGWYAPTAIRSSAFL